MRVFRKRSTFIIAGIVLIYIFTPLVAGMVGTYDRRGPKVFFEFHHEILYRIGYSFTHDDKPRVPLTERAWFYGLRGQPLDLDGKMQELDKAVK